MDHVIFESNDKSLVDAIHSKKPNFSEFDTLVDDCKVILHIQQTFKICFVKKHVNMVVYALAKTACSDVSPSFWYFQPRFLNILLLEDLNTSLLNNI